MGKIKRIENKSETTKTQKFIGPKLQLVKSAESRFEVLFENANDAILVVDLNHYKIVSANRAAQELTGYLQTEIEEQSVDLICPKPSAHLPQHSKALHRGHISNSGFFEDLVFCNKDGFLKFVSMSVKTLNINGDPVAMCILRDVSEKKNMERELITKHSELRNAYVSLEKANLELKAMQETLVQSGKLAALGELAAGIAHELNQPLTGVTGFAQEAMLAAKNSSDTATGIQIQSYLEEVIKGADKMQRIIAHLRNFTRKSTENFELVNVHEVIDESLLMLDKQLRSRGIQVKRSYDQNIPKIYCNPFQLEQVFINLATNARDAIEAKKQGGGTITITTVQSKKDFIEIKFEDDGCGIPENVKSKIFNPFFTTKEVGKGMGLGLSISYGILSRINASILVESNINKGTVFSIKLPVDYRKH